MPELPEVETLRRGLAAALLGKRIDAVAVLWRPSFDVAQARIDALVAGHRITAIRRRGKVLLLELDGDRHLLVHPKMTGQLVIVEHGSTPFRRRAPLTDHARADAQRHDPRRVLAQRGHGAVF
ncbi:MAG: DNA-formamidopyrimidine glycosylase family protein [Mycobacteriales bacterium]